MAIVPVRVSGLTLDHLWRIIIQQLNWGYCSGRVLARMNTIPSVTVSITSKPKPTNIGNVVIQGWS